MTEHQIEFLEKNFGEGCVLVFRRPRNPADAPDAEPISVYMCNPKKAIILQHIAEGVIAMFDGPPPDEEEEDLEGPDELGLFKE